MTTEINLPEEESTITVVLKDKKHVIDAVELDLLISDVQTANEDQPHLEFVKALKDALLKTFHINLTSGQVLTLLSTVQQEMKEVKKNSSPSQEHIDITDSVFPSTEEDSTSSSSVKK